MDIGRGVQQSYVEVPAGYSEFWLFHKTCILTFQAGLTVIEVDFKAKKEDSDPEPLRMEHFYFPLGLWLVGILLSVFSFLAEIIIHRLRKSKATLEEPGFTQSTPGSEDGHISNVEDTKENVQWNWIFPLHTNHEHLSISHLSLYVMFLWHK